MMQRRQFIQRVGAAATLGLGGWRSALAAEEAMSARHITIGNSIPTDGVLGNAGREHIAGMQAAFAEINRGGGIHGRELRLLTKNDSYNPQKTLENIQGMVQADAAFCYMSLLGTPNNALALPVLEKASVPVVGLITGASSLRKPDFKHVFHVRPSYTDEVDRMVGQIVQMGFADIAIVYLDNPFGKEVLANAQAALARANVKAAATLALSGDGKNAADLARRLTEVKPGAVFLASTGTGTTDLILAVRERNQALPFVGLSVTYTEAKRLGKHLTGLAQAAVFPNAKSQKFAVVRNFWSAIESAKLTSENGLGLESYVNALVLAEGLRRAGRDLTREKLRTALAGIRNLEIGEVNVSFGAAAPYVGTRNIKMGVFDGEGVLRT
jgi:ABC-type branched-subunit amino acid transport system substrate-binding protein